MRRVKHLVDSDESAKVLVFSTWQDLLDVVAHALVANGVPFACCQGKGFTQSVRDFQAGHLQAGPSGRSSRCCPAPVVWLAVQAACWRLKLRLGPRPAHNSRDAPPNVKSCEPRCAANASGSQLCAAARGCTRSGCRPCHAAHTQAALLRRFSCSSAPEGPLRGTQGWEVGAHHAGRRHPGAAAAHAPGQQRAQLDPGAARGAGGAPAGPRCASAGCRPRPPHRADPPHPGGPGPMPLQGSAVVAVMSPRIESAPWVQGNGQRLASSCSCESLLCTGSRCFADADAAGRRCTTLW